MNKRVITTPWTPHVFWPFMEWQGVMQGHGDNRRWWREWRIRWPWRKKQPMITAQDVMRIERIVEKPFDWLKEYGPLWEPDSKAFWLAPSTHRELADWFGTYRPGVQGRMHTENIVYGDITIDIRFQQAPYANTTDIIPHYTNPYMASAQQAYQQAYRASLIEQQQSFLNGRGYLNAKY